MNGRLGFTNKSNLGMGIRTRGILGGDCRQSEEVLLIESPAVRMDDGNAHVLRIFCPNFMSIEDLRLEKLLGVLHKIDHKVGINREQIYVARQGCEAPRLQKIH